MVMSGVVMKMVIMIMKYTWLLLLICQKVQLFLCLLIKNHDTGMYWGVEIQVHIFLTLVLDGGEWSTSCPSHFTLGETVPCTHYIGGWVGPTTGLDTVVKKGKVPVLN
jgi:hypothetical protein